MKVLGVIPARWGSTRFPGKPLCLICGKPMIQWVWERARLARCLDELIVATDDRRIADACRNFGAAVAMTSPDHPTGTDRVAEVARMRQAEVVVNIQGDEPLLDPAVVSAVVERLRGSPHAEMATAAVPCGEEIAPEPHLVKVVLDRDGCALYFSRAGIPFRRREPAPEEKGPVYRRHVGLYAYRRDFLLRLVENPPCLLEQVEGLEQLRALYLGAKIAVVDVRWEGTAVDRPEDVARVERRLRESGLA